MNARGGGHRPKLFRLPSARHRLRGDIERELRFHIEERIDELVERGYPREHAEREVRERFGDISVIREACEEIDTMTHRKRELGEWWDAFKRDTRYALRGLAQRPGFAAVVIATIALGIGATTAIFALLDAVVLQPLPYANADRLVWLDHPMPKMGENDRWRLSESGYFHIRRNTRSFSDIGVFTRGEMNLVTESGAERAAVGLASASLFDVLGARPILGRAMTEDDNLPNAAPVALLGYDFWQQRFGGDPSVVGRTVNLTSTEHQIIGILPRGFHLPDFRVEVWIPGALDPNARPVNSHYLNAIARLQPGVTVEAAQADFARLVGQFAEQLPQAYGGGFMEKTGFGARVIPLRDNVIGGVSRALWILLGAVAIVFLVACANVANIFLVRSETRRRELAIRTALGADRSHVAGHFVTESVILSLIGGVIGIGLAYAALRALLVFDPTSIPRLDELTLGWHAVVVALGVALGAGIVFGLLPLSRLAASGVDVSTLREGGRGQTASRAQHAVRGALIIGQMALALVLLAAAGLMLRSFQRLRDVHPGFNAEGVLTLDVSLPWSRYGGIGVPGPNPDRYLPVYRFHRALSTRIAALPNVASVSMTQAVPLRSGGGCSLVFIEGRETGRGAEAPCLPHTLAAPGFFETMQIPIRGHAPTWSDMDARTGGVVVTQAFAERMWPGEDAIGKQLRPNGVGEVKYTVVGVAGDFRQEALDQPPVEMVLYPMIPLAGAPLWSPPTDMSLVVRTRSGDNAIALVPAIRRIVTEMDREVPIANAETMGAVIARSTERTTFSMMLLAIAGGMALVLSAVGIYGVISYIVNQRRSEIGVRMALGAQASQVGKMVVLHSLRLAAAGVAIGLVGAIAATRVMQSLLFGVSPTDPLTLVAVSLVLLALAMFASYVPARRATRVDPVEALRAD